MFTSIPYFMILAVIKISLFSLSVCLNTMGVVLHNCSVNIYMRIVTGCFRTMNCVRNNFYQGRTKVRVLILWGSSLGRMIDLI